MLLAVSTANYYGNTSITGKSVANILGTLNTTNDYGFTVDNSVLNVGGDMVNFESGATILRNNSIGVIGGSLSNYYSNLLTVDQSVLTVRGNVENGGYATLMIENAATLNVLGNFSNLPFPATTMTLDGGSTVNVAGTFTNGLGAVLMMSGTNDVLNAQGLFTNAGSVAVGSLDTLNANGGFANSGGNVSISSGGTLSTSNYSQSSGLTDVSGNLTSHSYSQAGGNTTVETGGVLSTTTFTATGGTVTVDRSSLTVGGDYNNNGLGATDVSNGGTLKVLGNFTNNSSPFSGPGFSLLGGSSAVIAGNFVNGGFSTFTVDDSALTVHGNFTTGGTVLNTIIGNGATVAVQGNFGNFQESQLYISGGSSLTVSGNADNTGVSWLSLGGSTMAVQGNFDNSQGSQLTLQNGSTLTVNGTFTNGFADDDYTFLKLSGPGNTAGLYAVQNNALIEVAAGSSLTVTGGGFTNNAGGPFNPGGTLSLGGSLNAIGGFTNNGGTVITNPGSTLITSTYSQSGGLTDVSGTLVANSYRQGSGATTIETGGLVSATTFNATGGTVTVNGILDPTAVEIGSRGALQGTGTIIGNVAMGGTIMPGAPGTPGTLTIFGNYEQIGNGTLVELMSPLSHSFLNVNGSVALDSNSRLDIILLNGDDPLGQTFSIMDDKSLVGQFSNGSSFWDDGYLWDITYGQHEVDVTAVGVPEPSSLLQLLLA